MNTNRTARIWRKATLRTAVRNLLVGTIALALTSIALAQFNNEDNYYKPQPTVKFKGAIGVIPVTGVAPNGTVNLNVVRGVSPGAPWRIAALDATVNSDGHIRIVGRGLLLATGNGIGTNGGQSVHASLFCGAAATATEHDTNLAGVALAADGDFTINDFLSPLPPSCLRDFGLADSERWRSLVRSWYSGSQSARVVECSAPPTETSNKNRIGE